MRAKTIKNKVSATKFQVPVYTLSGRKSGNLNLPKEIFAAKVNKTLLAQALRVYLNNLKAHHSHTKTRGEVKGSTRKIYSQKGTGRARHGAKTAPIFVGGGVALGPKFRKVILDFPKKMRRAALLSALSQKMSEQEVLGVRGVDKASGKTKEVVRLVEKLNKKSLLITTDGKDDLIQRACGNLPGVDVLSVDQLNVLEVIRHQTLILTKEAVSRLEEKIKNKKERKL